MREKILFYFFLIVFVISCLVALGGLGKVLQNDEKVRNNQALDCEKVTIHCVGE